MDHAPVVFLKWLFHRGQVLIYARLDAISADQDAALTHAKDVRDGHGAHYRVWVRAEVPVSFDWRYAIVLLFQ